MSHWKDVRERYHARFGCLVASHLAGTGDAMFSVLQFHDHERGTHTFVSLGAATPSRPHEAAIVSTKPHGRLAAVVDLAASSSRCLESGAVMLCAIPRSPFIALLCLPVQDEGSFGLGPAGGAPHVYQLAALTEAELAMAEQDPLEAFAVLRDAGALVFDPLRPCAVMSRHAAGLERHVRQTTPMHRSWS